MRGLELKDLTISALEEMTEEEVIAVAMESFTLIPSLDVHKKTLQAADIYKAKFDLVKKYIRYDFDNYTVQYPYTDEREDVLYSRGVWREEIDSFPTAGYYVYIDSKITVRPFGLMEVEFKGEHLFRNTNEHKHYKPNKQFQTIEYFYYDFSSKNFVQINDDDLQNARKLKLKSEEKYEEKTKQAVKEYIHREELLDYTKGRLKKRARKYEERFRKFKEVWGIGSKLNTFEKIQKFFDAYIEFLAELETGLQIKLIYSKLTNREFIKLEDMRKELLEKDIEICDKSVSELFSMMKKKKETGKYTWDNVKTFNLNSLQEEELEVLNRFRGEEVKRLLDFLMPRSQDFSVSTLLQGYIGYDLELKELYPNLAFLEKRDARTTKNFSDLMEMDRQKMILGRLEQYETLKELPGIKGDEWFTTEELMDIMYLNNGQKLNKAQIRGKQLNKTSTEILRKWEELKKLKEIEKP